MNVTKLVAVAAIIVSTFGATAAIAAPWSSTTCGEYSALGQVGQDDIASQIHNRDVSKTTSNANDTAVASTDTTQMTVKTGGSSTAVSSRIILAACQTKTPLTTLGELASTAGVLGN